MASNPTLTKIVVNGKSYVGTDEEFDRATAAAARLFKPTALALNMKAAEARAGWDSHAKARKDFFFLIPAISDHWSPAPFPPESVVATAERAASQFEKAVGSGDIKSIAALCGDAIAAVERAILAVRAYHDGILIGSTKAITGLEYIKTGAGMTLTILGAFSGGASVVAQSAVGAAVGSYDELIKQIEKSGGPGKIDPVLAVGTVLIKGSVEGLLKALFAKGEFGAEVVKGVAKKLTAMSFKRLDQTMLRAAVEKMWEKGMEEAAKGATKSLVGKLSYDSKLTGDQAVKLVADESIKSARVAALLSLLDERLEGVAKAGAKYMKPEFFKGLGAVDYEKALRKGGDKLIEKAFLAIAPDMVSRSPMDARSIDLLPVAIAKAIGADTKLQKELMALAAKK